MSITTNFRKLIDYLVPSWLSAGEGGKFLHSCMALVDCQLERTRLGLLARFPSYAGDSALRLIQRDRGIIRGRSESREHYAARARAWRSPRGHRVRGNAAALLEQICEYFGGVWCQTIDRSGNRYRMAADRSVAVVHGLAFDGDAAVYPAAQWGRYWVALMMPGARLSAGEPAQAWLDWGGDLWGGELDTPGTVIGLRGLTPDDVATIRGLFAGPRPWRPDGTRAEWLTISLNPDYLPGTPARDWAKVVAGVTVPARENRYCRYVCINRARNAYSGQSDLATARASVSGIWAFTGDSTLFPGNSVLPDGTVYVGDPTSFPMNVQLPDDGDLP